MAYGRTQGAHQAPLSDPKVERKPDAPFASDAPTTVSMIMRLFLGARASLAPLASVLLLLRLLALPAVVLA